MWLVLDMDDGLLRREPTRKDALQWWMRLQGETKVLERHTYGPGAYSYITGTSPNDNSGTIFIETEEAARRSGGWNPDQPALYPIEDDPFNMVDRPETEE